jgi:hypothetical protein
MFMSLKDAVTGEDYIFGEYLGAGDKRKYFICVCPPFV